MERWRNSYSAYHTTCPMCGQPIRKGDPVATFSATEVSETLTQIHGRGGYYEHPSCADAYDAALAEERAMIDDDYREREI